MNERVNSVIYLVLSAATVLTIGCGKDFEASSDERMAAKGGYAGDNSADMAISPTQNEKYESTGTNPFVIAAHDPFSTFAADVDTASYDIFRRDVNNGYLPDPASVRLEEYVNYFTYDYDAPATEDAHPFKISLAAAPNIIDRPTTLLRVAIQAKNPPPFEKKPANLVFLIDTSGSMDQEDKLPLVQHIMTRTLDVLDETDTVSLVTYASSTGVQLKPTAVSSKASPGPAPYAMKLSTILKPRERRRRFIEAN